MIVEFSPKGVYYLEIDCGENPRSAFDYLTHYRSPHMLGIDADYAMSRAYRSQGWPSFMVVDSTGVIRFHGFDPDRRLSALRKCVEELLEKQPIPADPKTVLDRKIAIPEEVLAARRAVRERSPRLAVDRGGNPILAHHSNRDGTNAVYLRRYSQRGDNLEQLQVSPPGLDSYNVDCTYDTGGTLWLTWCSGSNGFYDIYVQSRGKGQPPRTEALTRSPDDAMSPKIAAGPGGTLTVTYYEWRMMNGISRDRDIYARTYDPLKRTWAAAVEISPHKPEVEDHSDPDTVNDSKGNSWVFWSFDYHPSLYKKPLTAAEPTIFAARLSGGAVSGPMLVGGTGELQHAIDFFPSAAIDSHGGLWCAWDCSEPRRWIRLARASEDGQSCRLVSTFGQGQEICSTPELSSAGDNLLLAWSQRTGAQPWQGRVALLKEGRSVATKPLVETGDVLFVQAQQGPDGQVWVAYEKADAKGSEVMLKNITQDLKTADSKQASAR